MQKTAWEKAVSGDISCMDSHRTEHKSGLVLIRLQHGHSQKDPYRFTGIKRISSLNILIQTKFKMDCGYLSCCCLEVFLVMVEGGLEGGFLIFFFVWFGLFFFKCNLNRL